MPAQWSLNADGTLTYRALNYDFHHISELSDANELRNMVVSNIENPDLFQESETLHRCRKDNQDEQAIAKHFLFE